MNNEPPIIDPLDMTVREFLARCEAGGLNFTYHWVLRRLKDLK